MKRFAVLQLSGCSGCEIALLNAGEWIDKLRSAVSSERIEAIRALARRGDPDSLPHLVPLMDDPDPAGQGMNLVARVAQERPIRALMNNSFGFGGTNATLTKHMFSALRDYIDPTIAAISTIMVAVSTILLLVTQFIGSRGK